MNITLVIRHELIASHSLNGREAPHPHRWVLEYRVAGDPVEGRIIDLPALAAAIRADLVGIEGSYLNECEVVDQATRDFPTCETLGAYLARRFDFKVLAGFIAGNPSLRLRSLQVTLLEMNGMEFGAALIEP